MRRRFGRGRKRGNDGDSKASPIDAALWLGRIAELGIAGTRELEPLAFEGIDERFAVLGSGRGEAGPVRVAFSPRSGGDALFAVLAVAEATEGFDGTAIAIAPHWDAAARRRLALVGARPYSIRTIEASQLGDRGGAVEPAAIAERLPLAPARISRLLDRPEDRDVFLRALAGLEGLAAKHGGVVRGAGERVEFVLLARRVATLEAGSGRVRLDVTQPERSTHDLDAASLSTALDRLEGALRKRLNDRRVRSGEEGLRTALLPVLERAGALRGARAWPAAWEDREEIDLVGTDAEGRWVVAVARARLGLEALGSVIDAALDSRARSSHAWSAPELPVREAPPRLLLAAQAFEASPLRVLSALTLTWHAFDIVARRTGEFGLEQRDAGVGVTVAPRQGQGRPGGRGPAPRNERETSDAEEPKPAREAVEAPRARRPEGEGQRDTRRDSRPSSAGATRGRDTRAPVAEAQKGAGGARFEEVSLFDLDDDGPRDGDDGARRRGRGRGGRRRGRRGRGAPESPGADGESAQPRTTDASEEGAPERPDQRHSQARGRGRRDEGPARSAARDAAESDDDGLVDEDALAPLVEDIPEIESDAPLYDEEDTPEEGDDQEDLQRRERERRRLARFAKVTPEVEEAPKVPRRRAAFVAHADRGSVITAVLLARDVRLVEGFWVYPQEDLMTFFHSIATDLREGTPIFLVGFNASPPARDTIQAASLHRGRLHWYDHHDWPPEDLVALREAIGEDAVHVDAGAESSLGSVISERTRRSRFSDKLVELATGRFTPHDYERWGRLWWHRIGEITKRRGDRRADIDALLAGRPSDLSKEAESFTPPPPPPEVEFVSRRDFRLVHFGGYVMVVLEVPEPFDLHLAARVARERYGAQMSLTMPAGGELLVLGGDEGRSKRALDLGSMADHLASKHEWITALRDDDHVARVRVRDLQTIPGRLDEVISEIAMGRSIVEG